MSNQQGSRAKNYRANQGIQQAQKDGSKRSSALCELTFTKGKGF